MPFVPLERIVSNNCTFLVLTPQNRKLGQRVAQLEQENKDILEKAQVLQEKMLNAVSMAVQKLDKANERIAQLEERNNELEKEAQARPT